MKKSLVVVSVAILAACTTAVAALDLGDNSSQWAYDGECDDPRFEGPGVAATLLEQDRYHDAADCGRLLSEGRIWLRGTGGGSSYVNGINMGNNTSQWAYDGECDDPRFEGPGEASSPQDENRYRDAADCGRLLSEGRIWLRSGGGGGGSSYVNGINMGDNTSQWANDGECDDPRFAGPGTASTLLEADRYHDAADCGSLLSQGRIWLRDGGGSHVQSGVNFGDNSSQWAFDGECDDPRFAGPGTASTLIEADRYHDAADCSALMAQGRVWLR